MKRSFTIILVIVASLVTSNVWAQEQGHIKVGGSLVLGTKAGIQNTGESKLGLGVRLGGDYFVIYNLSAGLNYSFFFKSSAGSTGYVISQRISSFNIDGKYYVLQYPVHVYGLLGLSIASVKSEAFGLSVSDSKIGINIGLGVEYPITDKLYLESRLNYNSPLKQLVLGLGVGYVIK